MNKVKELLVLATHFYTEWRDGTSIKEDKELRDLMKTVAETSKKYIVNEQDIANCIESVYKKLEHITSGKEVEANAIILSLGSIMLLLEDNIFKGSSDMKVKRISNSLYNEIEAIDSSKSGFRNANKLIGQLDNIYKTKETK